MSNWSPLAGPRVSKAWRGIVAAISDGKCSWVDLRNYAERFSDVQPKTINNLISDAVRHGFLEKSAGRYSLTAKGAACMQPGRQPDDVRNDKEDRMTTEIPRDVPIPGPALDLDAIEARVLDAVSGPWDAHLTEWEAREDVPALVAEVRRLRAELEQACAEMAAADRHCKGDPCEICTHMSIEDALAEAEAAVSERDRARDTAAAAEAELARVAELHSEGSGGADAPVPWCLECSTPWPCPTTRAITQGWPESEALGGLGAPNTADGHSGTGEAENGPQSGGMAMRAWGPRRAILRRVLTRYTRGLPPDFSHEDRLHALAATLADLVEARDREVRADECDRASDEYTYPSGGTSKSRPWATTWLRARAERHRKGSGS